MVASVLVQGTEDEAVAVSEGEALHEAIPDAWSRLVLLSGANHTLGAAHPLETIGPELERAIDTTVAHFREHLR